jgi:hypothetical protein
MAAIALFALVKNEIVLRRSPGGRAFRAETSLLPLAGPQGWRGALRGLAEMGLARLAGGLAAYGGMLMLHPLLFGVDPLYWIG